MMLAIEWAIGIVSCLVAGVGIKNADKFAGLDGLIFLTSLVGTIWFVFRLFGWQ